jgi:hypothetical protein
MEKVKTNMTALTRKKKITTVDRFDVCPRHAGIEEKFETFSERFETVIARLDSLKDQITKQFDMQDQAVKAALVAADRAVSKAEIASEKRFDSVNEFRKTLDDYVRSLMPRMETETLFKNMGEKIETITSTLVEKIGAIERNLSVGSGQEKGKKEGSSFYMMIVSMVFSFIATAVIVIHAFK